MIIVITTMEKNERNNRMERIISHGIDQSTGKTVILPCEPPETLGAVFNPEIGEYILEEKPVPPSPEKGLRIRRF